MSLITWLNSPAPTTGHVALLNRNKNGVLAVFFGIASGLKEHCVLWGLFITLLGFGIFA